MRFHFIAAEKDHFPIRMLCRVLQVTAAGFYAWRRRGPSERATADAQLAVAITASHRASRCTYGSPRVHRDLREQGRRHGRKRVARIMRERQLVARQKRRIRRTTDSRHAFPIAPNWLKRRFAPAKPNQVWAADVTYLATLRAELVDHEHYATREAAIASIGDYIDGFYNVRRRHSFLGYVSPLEFEVRARRWRGPFSTRDRRRSPGVVQKPTSPNGSRALPRRGAATSVSPGDALARQSRPQESRGHQGDPSEANPNVHA